MPDFPPPTVPRKIPSLAWGALLAAAALAYPTWKFGLRFLRQFFISPFQFFILPLWLIAYFSVRTGIMPTRSGPSIRRDEDPSGFWQSVWGCILLGAGGFALNLWISWLVVSR